MKKYSFEIIITAALAAIAIQPAISSGQDCTVESGKEPTEAEVDLRAKEFDRGKEPVAGETFIMISETEAAVQEKRTGPATISFVKPQTKQAIEGELETSERKELNLVKAPAERGSIIRLGNGELFNPGSSKLNEAGQETLANVVAMINRHASPEINLVVNTEPMLARKRANAVRNYLAKFSKITVERIKVVKSIESTTPKEPGLATNIPVPDR